MGIFSKIKEALSLKKKNKVSTQIQKKQEENSVIKQEKFDQGLKKSSNFIQDSLNEIAKSYVRIDEQLIEKIENFLLQFDIGYASVHKILDSIVEEIKFQKVNDPKLIKEIIVDKLFIYYIQDTDVNSTINIIPDKPNVILVTGVNGVGKTTSIAKLANKFIKEGLKVGLVAADTFRAGAVEQLSIWAQRLNIPIYKPAKPGQDPASVVYSGITQAFKDNLNVVICDTSGRLQNKVNLMNELKKIDNIIKRFDNSQPIESLLVIDATTGQSGINQARAFNEVTKLTGIILTKMDSTSKGGIILSIKDAFNLPVKFIGLGEKVDDLEEFDLEKFVYGITNSIII